MMQKKSGEPLSARWKAYIKKNPGIAYLLYAAVGILAVLLYLSGSRIDCTKSEQTETVAPAASTASRDALE